jgi:hypothetical protein
LIKKVLKAAIALGFSRSSHAILNGPNAHTGNPECGTGCPFDRIISRKKGRHKGSGRLLEKKKKTKRWGHFWLWEFLLLMLSAERVMGPRKWRKPRNVWKKDSGGMQ